MTCCYLWCMDSDGAGIDDAAIGPTIAQQLEYIEMLSGYGVLPWIQ